MSTSTNIAKGYSSLAFMPVLISKTATVYKPFHHQHSCQSSHSNLAVSFTGFDTSFAAADELSNQPLTAASFKSSLASQEL